VDRLDQKQNERATRCAVIGEETAGSNDADSYPENRHQKGRATPSWWSRRSREPGRPTPRCGSTSASSWS